MTTQILVVDDEPDLKALFLQKFRRQIQTGGMSFRFAGDGVEALELLQANASVDMVVADLNMPRMDGLTLLQKLQETAEHLSTIIVSANGDMSNIRTAMNRGAFDFVTKPIDFVIWRRQLPKRPGTLNSSAKHGAGNAPRNGPMPHCRATSRRTWPNGWPATLRQSISAGSAAKSRRCFLTSRGLRPWSRP